MLLCSRGLESVNVISNAFSCLREWLFLFILISSHRHSFTSRTHHPHSGTTFFTDFFIDALLQLMRFARRERKGKLELGTLMKCDVIVSAPSSRRTDEWGRIWRGFHEDTLRPWWHPLSSHKAPKKKGEKRRMLKQLIVPCNWLRQKRGRKAIEMENLFWLLLFLFFINETEPSMKCFQTNLNRDCDFGCWFKQRKWMSRSLQIFSKLFLARKTKLGGIAFKQWRRTRHFARTFCWSALMSLSCLYGFLWLPFKKVNSIMSDDDDDD